MNAEHVESDLSGWFSTYGLITAQRILESYKIKLATEDLLHALKTPNSFYHRLIKVPLRNVFNGIILQQARDYQLYAQKLFIDYLLSGESGKVDEAPGANTREDLEQERQSLMQITERFHALELAHEKLIAQSQMTLRQHADEWQKHLASLTKKISIVLKAEGVDESESTILQALITLLTDYDFKGNLFLKKATWVRVGKIINADLLPAIQHVFINEINTLSDFTAETESALTAYAQSIKDMSYQIRQFRKDFYQFIIHVNELIKLLPDYRIDNAQIEENRESLRFDSALGEDSSTS